MNACNLAFPQQLRKECLHQFLCLQGREGLEERGWSNAKWILTESQERPGQRALWGHPQQVDRSVLLEAGSLSIHQRNLLSSFLCQLRPLVTHSKPFAGFPALCQVLICPTVPALNSVASLAFSKQKADWPQLCHGIIPSTSYSVGSLCFKYPPWSDPLRPEGAGCCAHVCWEQSSLAR